MTPIRAWELSVAEWSYFTEVPSARRKSDLPKKLYDKIKTLKYTCPLCDTFFRSTIKGKTCKGCPIENNCIHGDKLYLRWTNATTDESRRRAARRMLYAILDVRRP
jgi:hypothetical protein